MERLDKNFVKQAWANAKAQLQGIGNAGDDQCV
jgi:hypothetical protein